jgi:hypothetical protein
VSDTNRARPDDGLPDDTRPDTNRGPALPVIAGTDIRIRPGMSRREALRLMAVAASAPAAFAACAPADETGAAADGSVAGAGGASIEAPDESGLMPPTNPRARGDAWDPDLLDPQIRWEKVLTEDELAGLAVLCDVIIPADGVSPSASATGCHDYIDEWVSAPYSFGEDDRVLVRGGLAWMDTEASERFGSGGGAPRFRDLTIEQRHAICDDICHLPDAAPEHRMPARFFDKVRSLTMTAFYTTEEGMEDIGYIGNVPSPTWGPPPPEVLRHLGIEDEVGRG